jgi:hypothetical protein
VHPLGAVVAAHRLHVGLRGELGHALEVSHIGHGLHVETAGTQQGLLTGLGRLDLGTLEVGDPHVHQRHVLRQAGPLCLLYRARVFLGRVLRHTTRSTTLSKKKRHNAHAVI